MALLTLHGRESLAEPFHAEHDIVAFPIRTHLASLVLLTIFAYFVEAQRAFLGVIKDSGKQELLELV